jgi:hypothetical protein
MSRLRFTTKFSDFSTSDFVVEVWRRRKKERRE